MELDKKHIFEANEVLHEEKTNHLTVMALPNVIAAKEENKNLFSNSPPSEVIVISDFSKEFSNRFLPKGV